MPMTPNQTKFREEYERSLVECVANYPKEYAWPAANAPMVADKMMVALDKGTANITCSRAFPLTAKRLGIKPTKKAIYAYWNS